MNPVCGQGYYGAQVIQRNKADAIYISEVILGVLKESNILI